MTEFIKGDFDIAVVGMACCFPEADSLSEFWENLCNGKDCISRNTALNSNDGTYIGAYGKIKNKYDFANQFFHISQEEAAMLDPQQRIFTEIVYQALLDAGCEACEKKTGVFAGADEFKYVWSRICRNGFQTEEYLRRSSMLHGSLASKLSYQFNFTGSSMTLHSGCTTSIAAVHFAVNALLNYECDVCIAGGVSIDEDDNGYQIFKNTLSTDGYTRAFDKDGTGFVPGNGAGAVVLKRLEDAVADKNKIYAVIRATALNNDGNEKAGYTSPSYKGQSEVIRTAYELSGIDTKKVEYIECHGTGTVLGDTLELKALGDILSGCRIGSVKTNIGHTNAASGIASFIKAALMVYYQKFVPTLHCRVPNETVDEKQFILSDTCQEWKSECRIAGINSFGIGGTNCHIIIENYPIEQSSEIADSGIWVLSADNKEELAHSYELLKEYLHTETDVHLENIEYTLLKGRKKRNFRSAGLIHQGKITAFSNADIVDAEETDVEQIIISIPETSCISEELVYFLSCKCPDQNNNIHELYQNFLHRLTDCDIQKDIQEPEEGVLLLNAGTDRNSLLHLIGELWKYDMLKEENFLTEFVSNGMLTSLPFRFREKTYCFEER